MKRVLGIFHALSARMSIGTRFAIGAILSAVLVCAASLWITMQRTETELSRLGMEKINQNMNTLWAIGRTAGWPPRLQDGKLFFGDHAVNDNHAIVDQVKAIGGGTATIFQLQGEEFVRVTTNVPAQNSSGRAIGTKLARNAAYAANIRGENFRGRVEILGTPYFTGYDPIKDAQGRVIGIMYVGIPELEFTAAMRHITMEAIGFAVGVLAVAILGLWFATRRTIRPLVRMEAAMARISAGDTGCDIPGLGRHDEIGRMATAVSVFRDKVAENARNTADRVKAETERKRERSEMQHRLADQFESAVKNVIGKLADSSASLDRTADSMRSLTDNATRESDAVTNSAQQAAGNVQTVAAAAEQLSASVAEISRRVADSARIASYAVEEAGRTNAHV
jgi:methyl-accepting chemotaxis protein